MKTVSIPKDCWCGWKLTPDQQRTLISLTMQEFNRPIKSRMTAEQLVQQVLGPKYSIIKERSFKKT